MRGTEFYIDTLMLHRYAGAPSPSLVDEHALLRLSRQLPAKNTHISISGLTPSAAKALVPAGRQALIAPQMQLGAYMFNQMLQRCNQQYQPETPLPGLTIFGGGGNSGAGIESRAGLHGF